MKITKHFSKIHKTYTLIGGGAGLLAALSVACAVGSPLPVLRLLGADALLPPLWLVSLLWLAGFTLAGAAAGYVLASPVGSGARDALRWRGMTFLVVEVTVSFGWYSLLFGSFLVLPSLLCLLLAVGTGLLCALFWWSLTKPAAVAAALLALWHLCLLCAHLAVILHN